MHTKNYILCFFKRSLIGLLGLVGFFNISFALDGFDFFNMWQEDTHTMCSDSLLKKGEHLYDIGAFHSALPYFNEVLGRYSLEMKSQEKLSCARASNDIGMIYFREYNYVSAIKRYLWAMEIAREEKNIEYERKIENNIAGVYYLIHEYEKAYSMFKRFFEYNLKKVPRDSSVFFKSYSNLVMCAMDIGDKRRLSYVLQLGEKMKLISNPLTCYPYYVGYATYYRFLGKADSSIFFAKKSLLHIPNTPNRNSLIAKSYQQIALGYLSKKNQNVALLYLDTSNEYGKKNNIIDILIENYALQSDIFKQQGRNTERVKVLEKYTILKDSLLNLHTYGQLKELEFYARVSKNENRIILLQKEQQEKAGMIKLQKYTITIGSIFIFFLMLFLILVLKQKHSLNQNYRLLYEKQQELLRLANGKLIEPGIDRSNKNNKDSVESLGADSEDQKTKERRKQLAIGITEIIENADLVYNADFNLDMLAKKLNTNTHYISEAIHECFGKNFTTLVNEVRIKRACIYMNMPEYQKYTLDFIAHKVGFKSRATFNPAFKKYTGIIPSQYLKLSKKRS